MNSGNKMAKLEAKTRAKKPKRGSVRLILKQKNSIGSRESSF